MEIKHYIPSILIRQVGYHILYIIRLGTVRQQSLHNLIHIDRILKALRYCNLHSLPFGMLDLYICYFFCHATIMCQHQIVHTVGTLRKIPSRICHSFQFRMFSSCRSQVFYQSSSLLRDPIRHIRHISRFHLYHNFCIYLFYKLCLHSFQSLCRTRNLQCTDRTHYGQKPRNLHRIRLNITYSCKFQGVC